MLRPSLTVTELQKAITFSGRTNRAEFWWLAGPWLLVTVTLLSWLGVNLVQSTNAFSLWLIAFVAINLPVLSAAIRRLVDAGVVQSRGPFAGWGFSGLMCGPALLILWNNFTEREGQSWMVFAMVLGPVIGLLAMIYALAAPSKSHSSQSEVLQ
jgi:uncharacterized membrane protein YhaH (DUF805 family)